MTRLAIAIIVVAASGVAGVVTHHTKRPAATAPSVVGLPRATLARASRGENRLPLPVNAARREGVPRSGLRAVGRPAGSGSLDWDALAQCESGGDWHINTGNGFYGGVQFDPQTWESVGGHGLPSDASKAEQIARATILYDERGREPWPVCGVRL